MSQFQPPSQPGQWNHPEPNQSYPRQETSYHEWYQPQYPPPPGPYSPPPQPPHPPRQKMSNTTFYTFFSLACVIIIIVCYLILRPILDGSDSQPATPSSDTWTTTHTFSGNGIQETQTISLSSNWTLSWTCDPSSFSASYNVQVYIYNTDGSLADVAIDTLCSSSNTNGSTELHQGGDVYLKIISEAAWTLTIQELR